MIVPLEITTNGSGAGSATSPLLYGVLQRVAIDLSASTAALTTADVTITDSLGDTILTLSDMTADVIKNPYALIQDTDGADTTAYAPFSFDGLSVTVTVAQAATSETNAVIVKLHIFR